MTVASAAKNLLGFIFELLLGRRNLYRFARLLIHRARRDTINAPLSNGEYDVQDLVIRHLRSGVILDVGANIGEWSGRLLHQYSGPEIRVHAFEPCSRTFARLRENVHDDRLIAVECACSDSCGTSTINVVEDGCGRNSLVRGLRGQTSTEKVSLKTIDDYCREQRIDSIDLIKIDAEGHDLAVLRGAQRLLKIHAISALQFEYNHRWIFSRTYLKDAFEFLGEFGYSIGKIMSGGVEFYPEWDIQLETFCESNYLACLPSLRYIFHDFKPIWLRPGS